jgi:hypothetical protein
MKRFLFKASIEDSLSIICQLLGWFKRTVAYCLNCMSYRCASHEEILRDELAHF